MKYSEMLKAYQKDIWNKDVYVWKSKTKGEFSNKYTYIVGVAGNRYIQTIGCLFDLNDFKPVRKATKKDLFK